MEEHEIHSVIGDAGFGRLVAAFYRRVPGDSVLGPMYSSRDLADAEQHLREFLIYRFGGPPRYIEQRGHPRLRMRHAPFAIGNEARERWLALMNTALDESGFPPEVDRVLRSFFESTAEFLVNRPA